MESAKDMAEAIDTCVRLDDEFELDEWEENFYISVRDKALAGGSLSPKQMVVLEKIYDRT